MGETGTVWLLGGMLTSRTAQCLGNLQRCEPIPVAVAYLDNGIS